MNRDVVRSFVNRNINNVTRCNTSNKCSDLLFLKGTMIITVNHRGLIIWPHHCHQNCRKRALGHPRSRRRSPGAKISLVLSPYCKCRGHERILCSIERLPHHVSKEPPNRTPPSVDTVTGFPCQEIHLSRVSTIVPTSRTSKGLVIDCSGFSLVRTKYIFPSHWRTSKLTWLHRAVSPLVSAGCSTS